MKQRKHKISEPWLTRHREFVNSQEPLWATEDEIAEAPLVDAEPVWSYTDHVWDCLREAFCAALIFSLELRELSVRIANPPLTD
jgi:hypothetical protein